MVNNHAGNNHKWALLIGINKYPNLPEKAQLSGCVNDIKLINKVLEENFSFPEKNITCLLDEQATRQGILTALQELINSVNHNDIVVIHYSGHGSRMTDREGDKPDGKDETIMPYDTGRDAHENRDISDDELYEWLLRLSEKTPYITLIFDSCHSGGIVRDPFGASDRWVEPDTRPIEQLPPSPVSMTRSRGGTRDIGPSGWLPMSDRYVLIAGCSAEEKASDSVKEDGSEINHGALTYFLCKELRSVQSGTTYRDIFQRVSIEVTKNKSTQHPQLEGARDREFFNVHDIKPMRFVSIGDRKDNKVILNAGAAHGITQESEWAIYPEATKQIDKKTPKLGKVKITAVHAVTSDAEILQENPVGVITVGSRATEEAHCYGNMLLKVNIQVPTDYDAAKEKLIEQIQESKLLRFAQEGETADLMVYIIASRTEVSSDAPVPQLGVVNQPTWVVVGSNGQVIMPTRPVNEVGATIKLRENLEKIVRCKSLLALERDTKSLLNNKVKLTLKRQADDGSWVEAQPDDNSGQIVFEDGDRLVLEVENLHNDPIYIYILDLGLAYGVDQIYPRRGANQEFQKGKHNIGIRRGEEIELYVPEQFPYISSSNNGSLVGGIETFKLFATTYPSDFSWLLDEGVRQGFGQHLPNINKPLEQLLDMVMTGNGNREVRMSTLPPDAEWTTVQSSFWLQSTMS